MVTLLLSSRSFFYVPSLTFIFLTVYDLVFYFITFLNVPSQETLLFNNIQPSSVSITYAYLQLFVKLACKLGKPLADAADARNSVTFNIIPITSCDCWKIFLFLSSIHQYAWLPIFPIRFTWSPVCVVWN